MPEHPESFPVNALVPIPGTPLEGNDVNLQPSPVTAFSDFVNSPCRIKL